MVAVSMEVVCRLSPGGCPFSPYIGRWTRSVDRGLGRLQQGNLSLVCLHHGRLIRVASIRLDCFVLCTKLSSRLDKVGGSESRSVTTGKPISSLFTSWKAYPSCLNPSGLLCLVHQVVFSSGQGCLGNLLEGLQ
jgi:hypothetical protein